MDYLERRWHRRVAVDVEARLAGTPARVRSLSLGGVALEAPVEVQAGTHLPVVLGVGDDELELEGEVVARQDGIVRLRFPNLSPAALGALQRAITI